MSGQMSQQNRSEVRVISPSGAHGVIFRDRGGFRGLGTRTYCWIEDGEWRAYRSEDASGGSAVERAQRYILGSRWRIDHQ